MNMNKCVLSVAVYCFVFNFTLRNSKQTLAVLQYLIKKK